ncbi:MAG: YbaB/EbfC family nucleoid-associated protein [Acidobacteriia bacterium]|nr:YbaB/EbfC family nucleoid-associated protein [Terriglobia bacterium]
MNVAKIMQQAQQAQAQMQRMLGELEVEGSAGGGLVRVRLSGLKELKGVTIDTKALAGEEPDLVGDLIVAAWQEASRRLEEQSRELLGRLGMPAGFPGLI